MIEINNGTIPSPFDERVVDLYKKVDDAMTLGKTISIIREDGFVIRDALHLAVPMPLLVCKDIDEGENGVPIERTFFECPTCRKMYTKYSTVYHRRCSNCGQTFKLDEEENK